MQILSTLNPLCQGINSKIVKITSTGNENQFIYILWPDTTYQFPHSGFLLLLLLELLSSSKTSIVTKSLDL